MYQLVLIGKSHPQRRQHWHNDSMNVMYNSKRSECRNVIVPNELLEPRGPLYELQVQLSQRTICHRRSFHRNYHLQVKQTILQVRQKRHQILPLLLLFILLFLLLLLLQWQLFLRLLLLLYVSHIQLWLLNLRTYNHRLVKKIKCSLLLLLLLLPIITRHL